MRFLLYAILGAIAAVLLVRLLSRPAWSRLPGRRRLRCIVRYVPGPRTPP